MHELERILRDNEQWLMERILFYAKRQDYAKYTSTSLEAWRLSITGLTDALAAGLAEGDEPPELGPDERYETDPMAAFGMLEAQRHRSRGVNYSMFMGLFKYYRQTYQDLISEQGGAFAEETRLRFHRFLDRCFDRIEIAFSNQWVQFEGQGQLEELQDKNRTIINEKNLLLTLLENVSPPVVALDADLTCVFANTSFLELVQPSSSSVYYDSGKQGGLGGGGYGRLLQDAPWVVEMAKGFLESSEQQKSLAFTFESGSEKRYFDVFFSRMADVFRQTEGCVLALNEVSRLREAYWEVRESERKIQTILETTPLPLVITSSVTGKSLYANQRMADLVGLPMEQAIGASAKDFYVNLDERKEVLDLFGEEGGFSGLERQWINARGETFWVQIAGVSMTYGDEPAYLAVVQDITERKLAESALEKSEERFRSLINGLNAGVVVYAPDTSIQLYNPMAKQMFGLSDEEMLGRVAGHPKWHFIDAEGRRLQVHQYPVVRMLLSDKDIHGEIIGIVKAKGKHPVWIEVDAFRELDQGGQLKSIVVHFWDITKRRLAETALRESRSSLAEAQRMAKVGNWELDFATGRFTWSDEMYRLYETRPEEFTPTRRAVLEYIHPDDRSVVREAQNEVRKFGMDFNVEYRLRLPGGTEKILHCRGELVGEGEAQKLRGTAQDVTSRKRVEQALRDSERLLKEAQHIARVGNWHFDPLGGLAWSDEMYELFETGPEEFFVSVEAAMERVLPQDRHLVSRCMDTALADGKPYSVEYRITTFKGNERFILCRGQAVLEEGVVVGLKGTAQDITESKEAERSLRESEQFQRLLLRAIGAGVIMVRPKTLIVEDMNRRARELIGPGAETIVGQSVNELCWQDAEGVRTLGLPSMDEEQVQEFVLIRPDGVRIPVTRTTVFADVRGESMYVLVVFDITDRKALERQLNLAQKLEAIGSLAAGIAHEINTPVQYISSNITYLKRAFEELREHLERCAGKRCSARGADESPEQSPESTCDVQEALGETMAEIPEAISDCQEGITRVSEIVLSMRKFSHPGEEEPMPVDINAAIENTVTISRNEWKYVAEVDLDLAPDLPYIHFTPGDCNQVLLNVVVNAAHAIKDVVEDSGEKGRISISTTTVEGYVEVRIQDTGSGIKPQYQDKIFDPFFTTKEVGRGTGQGLAITHSILERFKGTITFETEPGQGTVFIIRMPVHEEETS